MVHPTPPSIVRFQASRRATANGRACSLLISPFGTWLARSHTPLAGTDVRRGREGPGVPAFLPGKKKSARPDLGGFTRRSCPRPTLDVELLVSPLGRKMKILHHDSPTRSAAEPKYSKSRQTVIRTGAPRGIGTRGAGPLGVSRPTVYNRPVRTTWTWRRSGPAGSL